MLIFFFKQKTAYEMRISDWSSDVCSSDLVDTKSASAGFVCNPGALCNSEPDWTWQTTSKHYSNVLPSVNVAINLKPDLIVRFAASQVIARPNYADMTNYFWLSDPIPTGCGNIWEERRGGNECGSRCRYRWLPDD